MGTIRLTSANGCWVDLFDAMKFQGRRCRLHGPADFPGLRVRETDWGQHVLSIVVGPTAYVQCFSQLDFDDTVVWLLPRWLAAQQHVSGITGSLSMATAAA